MEFEEINSWFFREFSAHCYVFIHREKKRVNLFLHVNHCLINVEFVYGALNEHKKGNGQLKESR